METLGKILGSPARVKIMRLFLLNSKKNFSNKEVSKRSRVDVNHTRKELRLLSSVKFIKKHGKDWSFNLLFKYGREFEELLVGSETLDKDAIADSFKKVGRIKLLLVSGVFIKNKDSRVDLLIVGDRMKRGKIDEEIRKLEAEIGMELVYAVFDSKDFNYRLNMFDKLIRDILDFPHEILLQSKELNLTKVVRQA